MSNNAFTLATRPLPLIDEILGDAVNSASVVPLHDGLRALAFRSPGTKLTLTAQQRLYDALVPLTSNAFGADMSAYWAQREREGYLERLYEFVMISDEHGSWLGWTGFHLLTFDVRTLIYLDSTGMTSGHQSKGVMRRVMHSRLGHFREHARRSGLYLFLTARSESPVFYRLMRSLLDGGTLYPSPWNFPDADVIESAKLLARWLGQLSLLEPSTLALRNAYGNLDELYAELPTTGDQSLDTLFRSQLGPLDAYLLVGKYGSQ